MRYGQTFNKECIVVHPLDDIDSAQYVELIKYGDEPKFAVWVGDEDDDDGAWVWEFNMTCPSDYERVKLSIFDAIFGCDTMKQLVNALDDIFENEFEDILIDDECECCGCCGDCEFVY